MSRAPFRRQLPRTWFLRQPGWRLYALRESSALGLGLWALNLLVGLVCLALGPVPWEAWVGSQLSPVAVGLHGVVLLLALLHSISWFILAPKALPRVVGGKVVPAWAVSLGHALLFVVITAALVAAVLGAT